jgi:hypothetical protein
LIFVYIGNMKTKEKKPKKSISLNQIIEIEELIKKIAIAPIIIKDKKTMDKMNADENRIKRIFPWIKPHKWKMGDSYYEFKTPITSMINKQPKIPKKGG